MRKAHARRVYIILGYKLRFLTLDRVDIERLTVQVVDMLIASLNKIGFNYTRHLIIGDLNVLLRAVGIGGGFIS